MTMPRFVSSILNLGCTALFAVAAVSVYAASAVAGPAFQIVSEDDSTGVRTLAVRLESRVADSELRQWANALRAARPDAKAPAKIAFYLPSMKLSQAPWAEIRFDADTKVSINGLRFDEIEAFSAEVATDNRAVIGHWLTSPPALPGKLTLVREKSGRMIAEWHLRNGLKTVDEVRESRSQRGRRYEIADADGGYYLVLGNGNLELGQNGAVIAIAERLSASVQSKKAKGPAEAASDLKPAGRGAQVGPDRSQPAAATAVGAATTAAVIPHRTKKPVRDAAAKLRGQPAKAHAPMLQSFSDAITGTVAR